MYWFCPNIPVQAIFRLKQLYTPTWDIHLSLKKIVQLNRCCFQYLWEKLNHPVKKIFFVTFRTCEKMEVKRGHLVKKWEFGQTKKILVYQFFKTRICAFMTYGQFPPKSSSNLRFVIRDSRVWGLCGCEAEDLKPLNLGWQISNLSYF